MAMGAKNHVQLRLTTNALCPMAARDLDQVLLWRGFVIEDSRDVMIGILWTCALHAVKAIHITS